MSLRVLEEKTPLDVKAELPDRSANEWMHQHSHPSRNISLANKEREKWRTLRGLYVHHTPLKTEKKRRKSLFSFSPALSSSFFVASMSLTSKASLSVYAELSFFLEKPNRWREDKQRKRQTNLITKEKEDCLRLRVMFFSITFCKTEKIGRRRREKEQEEEKEKEDKEEQEDFLLSFLKKTPHRQFLPWLTMNER